MKQYDLIILGSGPAGLEVEGMINNQDMKICIVDKNPMSIGGVCVTKGCMPTKFLAKYADIVETPSKLHDFGVSVPSINFDLAQITTGKNNFVSKLSHKHQQHLQADIVLGHARFRSNNIIEVTNNDGQTIEIKGKKIVIATGSRPSTLPHVKTDGKYIINSDHMLNNTRVPNKLLIVGGGVIGLEFASIYASFGSDVTIVEAAPTLLPREDFDTGKMIETIFANRNIQTKTNSKLRSATIINDKIHCTFDNDEDTSIYDQVLVSTGRIPNTNDLGLEHTDVVINGSFIEVNDSLQTAVPTIYAAGDVIDTAMLAHTAVFEAMVIADHINGYHTMTNNNSSVPRIIFTKPEIAGVGLTERQAKQQFSDVRIINFPKKMNGKNMIEHQTDGRLKLVFKGDELTLIGASIVGHLATEIIHELTLAVTHELTYYDLKNTIHAHPTSSEIIWFAINKGQLMNSTEEYVAHTKQMMSKVIEEKNLTS